MDNQNISPTDINQLKLNILNRSASFKKNRKEGSSIPNLTEGQESPLESTNFNNSSNGFHKSNYEFNENDSNNDNEQLYKNNNSGIKRSQSHMERKLETPSASASNNNINMNLQARVLAFHEQRQNLKRSSSLKTHSISTSEQQRQPSNLTNSSSQLSLEKHNDIGSRKTSNTKIDSSIETSSSDKRGSLGNLSPVTPSLEVVNKPLPPLPPSKQQSSKNISTTSATPFASSSSSLSSSTATTTTSSSNISTKMLEKKMQKLNMINNRNKNLLKIPTRKKIYDDETSSVGSTITTDSESDFDHVSTTKILSFSGDNGQKQKYNVLENEQALKRVPAINQNVNEKFGLNDNSELFTKPLSPKSYNIPRNNGSPSQLKRDNKPLSPLRVTSFGAVLDPLVASSSGQATTATGEMNPRRKAPPVPSNFQFPTSQISQITNANRNSMVSNEPPNESLKPNNRSQQKIKMGLSARRGLKLDMSKMHQQPTTSNPPPTQQPMQIKLPSHVQKTSLDFNKAASTDSLSSTDSNPSGKNTSGNWSNLSNNNRTSQLYGNAVGNNNNNNNNNNNIATTNTNNNHSTNPNGTDSVSSLNNTSNSGGVGSIFANFSKYVNIKNGSLNFAGKLSLTSDGINFSNGSSFSITFDELEYIGELGSGNYGNVSKVLHKPTMIIMAMKEVRLELDESKFRQILMELDVLHKCSSAYIVDFYGAFFVEGAVYMCMECMDGGSLDKLYSSKGACDSKGEPLGVPEPVLAKIAEAVISGLKVLKDDHNIIHRDVKPTNILCSAKEGTIKLCDFGVSGNLVASLAKTNIGCQSYMAPERIKSFNPDAATYTVHSDVWSLGLTLLEVALGKYPYPPETYGNIFSQLSAIVEGKPPSLPKNKFSVEAQDFINCCLEKKPERRPNYGDLLEHPWLLKYRNKDVDMKGFFTERLETIKKWEQEHNPQPEYNNSTTGENSLINTTNSVDSSDIPALHKGGWMSQ
mgnify:CR=1 FL=1